MSTLTQPQMKGIHVDMENAPAFQEPYERVSIADGAVSIELQKFSLMFFGVWLLLVVVKLAVFLTCDGGGDDDDDDDEQHDENGRPIHTKHAMSVERLLTNVLRLYQDVHDDDRTEQLYSTTTTLLTHLSNPLNITVLTSQLLNAPAIWERGDGMRACYRVISIFNSAATHVRNKELEAAKLQEQAKHKQPPQPLPLQTHPALHGPPGSRGSQGLPPGSRGSQAGPPVPQAPRTGGGLSCDDWVSAVLKGADDKSSRWQHLLVFCGVLLGMTSQKDPRNRHGLSYSMRNTVEQAFVTAVNLALRPNEQPHGQQREPEPPAPPGPIALALTYAFPLLSKSSRLALDCDAIVPVALNGMTGADGLQDGLFLCTIDGDLKQSGNHFTWQENSPSALLLRQLEQKPLVNGLGPLSKVVGFAIEHARDTNVVLQAQNDLLTFTQKLLHEWEASKLSEIEISEEEVYLTQETLQGPWVALWTLLRKVMYGSVAVLQTIVARSLLDPRMRNDAMAPVVASKTLKALRYLYFISSRNGSDAFQVYTFTYLTSVDNLARYSDACASFLRDTKPLNPGTIPPHPLHRTLDLFYLNVAEHLPLKLTPEDCDSLIVQPAMAYLTHSTPLSPRMLELFEAAHSAVLSVLSCPHNAPVTVKLAPFYAEALFSAFPTHISPRQFRLAFKTLMQILSPPYPISSTHPQLAETLLEMVRFRIGVASKVPLPPPETHVPSATPELPVSEQSTLVMTLIDSLPFLHLRIFEDWLTQAAHAVNQIEDVAMREAAKRRFWEILVSGEMDVERSAIGVAWWGTKGGRQAVLYGSQGGLPDVPMMSGAIQNNMDRAKL
ncbi:hypothetical protein NEUTE2DRAFT_158081 [Neurospora tetrasperma FGSC 2509]|nr:hypothetical protein NEUTE2DRAFT_158081 [Neurospora tetrasperma FGSC 2509]